MATSPAFASTPIVSGIATGTSASTTPFGTPSAPVTVYTAPSTGARIDEITIQGLGTTSANQVVLYVYNGTTYWPIKTVLTTATTASATVQAAQYTVTFNNLVLTNASFSIRAALFGADTSGYMVTAFGGSF
jgi:hypothetical protein